MSERTKKEGGEREREERGQIGKRGRREKEVREMSERVREKGMIEKKWVKWGNHIVHLIFIYP